MWKLRFWSISQCVIGSFPFLLSDRNGFIVGEVFVLSFMFSFLELYLCYKTTQDILVFYKDTGREPQLFGCSAVVIISGTLIIHRLLMALKTKHLIDKILSQIQYPMRFFTSGCKVVCFQLLSIVFRLVLVVVPNPVYMSLAGILPIIISYLILLTPTMIQSQYILVCYFLRREITNLNDILMKGTVVVDGVELRKVRKRLCKLSGYFDWSLRVFRVDLLLSVGMVLIFVLLSMNDLTLALFSAADVNVTGSHYVMTILYFVLFDMVESTCVVWLVITALKILQSVNC